VWNTSLSETTTSGGRSFLPFPALLPLTNLSISQSLSS
jgi:hypothetical protein